MRFCPHCRRLNPGRPMFCHYCARTWHVRLCPRGHENDADSQYCGICGSADLTETAGPVPFWIWLIRIGSLITFIILFILLIASFSLPEFSEFQLTDQTIALVIAITLFILVINVALSELPGPFRRAVLIVPRIIQRWCIRITVWCWERIKRMFD